ncbi:hypothetical protein BDZ94DRAFT_1286081 [Collybia nuda]|uniref:Uncharacterized protein n=1 Tax=Collybia nuda TaxID=64659 RepID=A0A9P5XQ43_9AGAR|nr:hypothetical protein BDZ94DRAFT_1286081 [Collybia nuda]
MAYTCPACGASVSQKYLKLHLERSRDQRCTTYLANLWHPLPDEPELQINNQRVAFGPASAHFGQDGKIWHAMEEPLSVVPSGDFFGNYSDYEEAEFGVEAADSDGEAYNSYENQDESDDDNDEWAANNAEDETGPELERRNTDIALPTTDLDELDNVLSSSAQADQREAEERLKNRPFIIKYGNRAGDALPLSNNSQTIENQRYHETFYNPRNPYAPFSSRIEWEIARWAKFRGASSTAFSDLMAIDNIVETLGLSFKNSVELNKLIDKQLPSREIFDVYFCDIKACIQALYGDPEFTPYLIHAPEMYHDMNTGEWWWSTQESLDQDTGQGATIIPIIISTDKTQLTLFRNKSAYPVYMTIGNIPKEIRRKPSRRAYILLGYLPTSRLLLITNQASRRRCLSNLYHACMDKILSPLEVSGRDGIAMVSGDGLMHRGHPLFACFVGDYPEQVLVTCTLTGDCIQCDTPRTQLGELPQPEGLRHLQSTMDILQSFDDNPAQYLTTCKENRVKPVPKPFWRNLPYVHIYRSITPDILHQLYQGVMKHVISWIIKVYGAAEIDARCHHLPPNHNIQLFLKGISSLSHVTGQEHSQMCQFILGLVIDISLPGGLNQPLIRSLCALLDFLYLAQYPIHTSETLKAMESALQHFHDNKHLFGTTDNFNTEYTERLHIDLAKDAYAATNHKDEYPQMTMWLERKEKIARHEKYIKWRLEGSPVPTSVDWLPPGLDLNRTLHMAKYPTVHSAPIERIESQYHATHFCAAFACFVVLTNEPNVTRNELERKISNVQIPCQSLPVWHRVKYLHHDPVTNHSSTPERHDHRQRIVPARFDTALISDGTGRELGVKGRRIAQIRVIFSIPEKVQQKLFHAGVPVPMHLAYVEWFTRFPAAPEPNHLMYKVSRCILDDSSYLASVIPVANIFRSVHLLPKFGHTAPHDWSSSNVLEQCKTFFANSFTDKHIYRTLH